jgi:glycosyltransferase involved in cell wall biosynthesis
VIWLAYIGFIFSIAQLLVALTNFLTRQALPAVSHGFNGLVSLLIPARDEEKNIAAILKDLQAQDYRNTEIIVFDDLSTDNTAQIVSGLSESDSRIRLIRSDGLPAGWLGKNHACHMLSKAANGDYMLFLDADVRLDKDVLMKAITLSETSRSGLLSAFPTQVMVTIGEQLTVPNMNYILLTLLPLILVRKSRYPSLAAANGQFMLFNSVLYRELSPHKKFRDNKVEDIAIARYFKQKHIEVSCITGISSIKCRMYEGFQEAVNGFSKNVLGFFGNSFVIALIFWFVTTFGVIAVFTALNLSLIVLHSISLVMTRVLISVVSRQNILMNLLLFIPQQFSMGLFIFKGLINRLKKQYLWKGRRVS